MNELAAKFGDRLQILAFPCNQFGHQENTKDEEILNSLKHVRPGDGYVPKFPLFAKSDVNGSNANPIFQFLRTSQPIPSDPEWAMHLLNDPKLVIWSPLTRNDIAWNFEKFLVDPEGTPYKRYSSKFETKDIEIDIQKLIEKFKVQ